MSERKYRVLWTEQAVRDLEHIISHIAVDSPGNARSILSRLQSRAAALTTSPMRGRIVPELAAFGLRSWRELIVKPYRIIYRIDAKTVFVLAVLDSRRDLEDLLLKRMIEKD